MSIMNNEIARELYDVLKELREIQPMESPTWSYTESDFEDLKKRADRILERAKSLIDEW